MNDFQSRKKSLSENFNMNHMLLACQLKDSHLLPTSQQLIPSCSSYPTKLSSQKSNVDIDRNINNTHNSDEIVKLNQRNSLSPIGKSQLPNYLLQRNYKLEQIDEELPDINLNSKDKRKFKVSVASTQSRKSCNFKLNNSSYISNLQTTSIFSDSLKDAEPTSIHLPITNCKLKIRGKFNGQIPAKEQRSQTPITLINYNNNGMENQQSQAFIDNLKEEIRFLKLENQQLHKQFLEITNIYSETTREFAITKHKFQGKFDSLTKCLAFATTKLLDVKNLAIKLEMEVARFKQDKLELKCKFQNQNDILSINRSI